MNLTLTVMISSASGARDMSGVRPAQTYNGAGAHDSSGSVVSGTRPRPPMGRKFTRARQGGRAMNRKLTFAATAVGVASTLMSGVAFTRMSTRSARPTSRPRPSGCCGGAIGPIRVRPPSQTMRGCSTFSPNGPRARQRAGVSWSRTPKFFTASRRPLERPLPVALV